MALGKGEDITSGEGEYKAVETFNDGTYDIPYYKIDPIAVTAENMDKVIIDGGFHTREDVYLRDSDKERCFKADAVRNVITKRLVFQAADMK